MAKANPNQPLHPVFDERVSVKVEGQLPSFVTRDHPTFVAFMEAYYEYMEQQGKPYEIIGNLNNYADLGKTTEDFLKYFKDQFAVDIPEQAFSSANKALTLKRLRDFYRAKGSEKSFQLFFRLLYNQEIEIYYPSVDILRTSDGRFGSSQIIRCIDSTSNDAVFDLIGKKIWGNTSGTVSICESVLKESVGSTLVSTIFVSGANGTYLSGEEITDGTNTFILGGMLTKVSIDVAGNNYSIGDKIIIAPDGGIINSGATIKVTKLSAGNIMKVNITDGGTGYQVGDKFSFNNAGKMDINGRSASLLVKAVDVNGTITELDLENMGRGYTTLPTISGGSGTGFVPEIIGWNIGGIKEVTIENNGFGFISTPTLNASAIGDGDAQLTATTGGYVDNFNEGFIGDNGFLSANKYIQDSNYYQLYSYVITSGETIDKWRNFVKRAVHPVGLALFGRFQLISRIPSTFNITNIPQDSRYTIIFHDGTIEPPTRLNVKVDSCEGEKVLIPNEEDYLLAGDDVTETQDDGLITENITDGEDYRWITENVSVAFTPTHCQIYEQELGIQKLKDGGFDDYLFVNVVATRFGEYGWIQQGATETADFGSVSEDILGAFSALRLGPLRRNLDRMKFNNQGGYSQEIGVAQQSGTRISNFANEKVSEYIYFAGFKTRRVTNATITQYLTGDEANSLPPS